MLSKLNWKKALIVLAVVVIFEAAWGVWTLTKGQGISPDSTISGPASLSLQGEKTEAAPGDTVKVDILLDTGNSSIDGVDAILTYDPKALVVVSVNPGVTFKQYPSSSFDAFGRIIISGISGPDSNFVGQAVFGSVTFKTVRPGKTTVKFDYQMGSTSDSNVTESGTAKDILEKVSDLTINVK